jgi:hypothetical protein
LLTLCLPGISSGYAERGRMLQPGSISNARQKVTSMSASPLEVRFEE